MFIKGLWNPNDLDSAVPLYVHLTPAFFMIS